MIPTQGRIVLAVIDNKWGTPVVCPAIVTQVCGNEPHSSINAQVFTDSDGGDSNHGLPNVVWKTSLRFTPQPTLDAHTWHWPVVVRVAAQP